MNIPDKHKISCRYLSQEDLLKAGCLDINLAMEAAEKAMLAFKASDILFPEKIVQIFNDDTQERINCLPATFLKEIVCDDWETVKHRTQTLSRMYKDGELTDADIHGNLIDLVSGDKPGRESDDERTYFNAVGLAYTDVGIAHAMYLRAIEAGVGSDLTLQETMIFEHADLKDHVRLRP